MAISHKDLRKKMHQKQQGDREMVKRIIYPLPNLSGPEGNAYALLARAGELMRDYKVPQAIQTVFQTKATGGDYKNLLNTIAEWFTVVVPVTTYAPLEGDITDLIPGVRDDADEQVNEELVGNAANEEGEDHDLDFD